MAKLLLSIPNPPAGMHGSQLFDDKDHLGKWLADLAAAGIIHGHSVTKTKVKFCHGPKPADPVLDKKGKPIEPVKQPVECSCTLQEVDDDYTN